MKSILSLPWHRRKVLWEQIDFNNSPKVRGELRDDAVLEFVDRMKAGDKFPPPRLCENAKKEFLIEDGLHRIHALHRISKEPIDCLVLPADYEACAAMALEENRSHGIRRSNADKRACVELAVNLWPGKSNREIADMCGVHHDLVGDVKQVKPPKTEVADSASGNATTPVNQPPSSPSKSSTPHKPANAGSNASPPAPAPKSKEEPKIVDSLDFIIPAELLPLWNRKHEIQDALTMLSKVKVGLESAIEDKDPLYAGLSHGEYQTAISDLKNARSTIEMAMPYVVCPNCQGVNPVRKNCRQCRAGGFVSKFVWNQQVPKELKAMRKIATAKQAEKKK